MEFSHGSAGREGEGLSHILVVGPVLSAGCALDLNKLSRDRSIDCLPSDGLELCSTLHAFGEVGGHNMYSWRSVESSQVAACLNIFQSAEIEKKKSLSASVDPSGHTRTCLRIGLMTFTSVLHAGFSVRVRRSEVLGWGRGSMSFPQRENSIRWCILHG